MLFNLKPKENRKELFGRSRELNELHRLIKSEWIIILGRRMTGKTSLLKTFLNEVNGIYVNLMGINSIRGFIIELIKSIKTIKIELDFKLIKFSWMKIAEDIFSKLEGKIIGLDEVQEIPSNYFLKLLKKIWDTYNVKLIMTGSMMGIIENLLNPKPTSPMYGRTPAILKLNPFTREQSREFLIKGFNEHKYNIDMNEINEVIELLNGYPGWLTYYGNYRCVRKLTHYNALEKVYDEGKNIMIEELNRFLRNKINKNEYIKLLKNLPAKWSELEKKLGVSKKTLRDMLKRLSNAMLIEKIGVTYMIPDPILRKLIMEL